jgi:hypothetical protein
VRFLYFYYVKKKKKKKAHNPKKFNIIILSFLSNGLEESMAQNREKGNNNRGPVHRNS